MRWEDSFGEEQLLDCSSGELQRLDLQLGELYGRRLCEADGDQAYHLLHQLPSALDGITALYRGGDSEGELPSSVSDVRRGKP